MFTIFALDLDCTEVNNVSYRAWKVRNKIYGLELNTTALHSHILVSNILDSEILNRLSCIGEIFFEYPSNDVSHMNTFSRIEVVQPVR